jgi:hypothetical protein
VLYQNMYPAPPEMRLPTGWKLSVGGIDILPAVGGMVGTGDVRPP